MVYKILPQLINCKLQNITESKISEYQTGFKKGKSVANYIFVLNQMPEKYDRNIIPIYALFIDFKNAYDKIKRDELYRTIEEMGNP